MRTKLFIYIFLFSFGTFQPCQAFYFQNSTESSIQSVFYKNGVLQVNGFEGLTKITVYSIIGNEIFSKELSDLNFTKNIPMYLKTGNMFIIQIHSNNTVKIFKIIA